MKIQVFCLLFIGTFLGGCVSHEFEIKDYSAKFVKRPAIGSVIGEDVNLPLVKDWTDSDFIVIEIYTKENLLALAKEAGSSLFPSLHFCGQPESEVLLGIHEVYAEGESVSNLRFGEKVSKGETERAGEKLYKYDVVIFTEWDRERKLPESLRKDKNQNYYLKFDLRKKPEDVCLSLRGSNIVQEFKSNQIKLPELSIREILN